MVLVVGRADAKEIGDDGVDVESSPEVLIDSGSVITARGWGLTCRLSEDMRENRLFLDQGHHIKIGVCDIYLWIVEADEFRCDVLRPLNLPEPVEHFLIEVDPQSLRPNE